MRDRSPSGMPLLASACAEQQRLSRRGFLAGAAQLALWSLLPGRAVAGTRDPRFLAIILRGGLDGLSLAAPVGDAEYARLRGKLALTAAGAEAGLPLDGFFVLNHAMPYLHALYQKREALVVHAVASPYRARSHFDGQDVLESGLPGVAPVHDGWLNRALAALPSAGRAEPMKGLAMAAVMPLVLRGAAPVLSWTPKANGLPLRESSVARLMDLYDALDPALARAFAEGLEIDRMALSGGLAVPAAKPAASPQATVAPKPPAPPIPQPAKPFRDFVATAEAAAGFMTAAGGPRIGAISFDGWDTHASEGAVTGQLANRLAGLDAALKAFGDGMGQAWRETVVVVVTEFGRTARINGTDGTDHGTGTVALVLGGAVNGGRVLADWPGLSEKALYEGRDLMPTHDLRAVMKGVLRDHLGLPEAILASRIFPDSHALPGFKDLLA